MLSYLRKMRPLVAQTFLTPHFSSFNKARRAAVRFSVIKKFLPFNFFSFLYDVLRTSKRADLMVMGLGLPSLLSFGLPTRCFRFRLMCSSRISISISYLTAFIITSVFLHSNS